MGGGGKGWHSQPKTSTQFPVHVPSPPTHRSAIPTPDPTQHLQDVCDVLVVVQQHVFVWHGLDEILVVHEAAALKKGEHDVVVEIDGASQLLNGFLHRGDVIMQLLEGLVQEEYGGGEAAPR